MPGQLLAAQQKMYYRLRPWRDQLVHPLVLLCATLRLNPNSVSLLGLVAMLGFVLTVRSAPLLATLLIAVSVVCDATDGALARHLKVDSDKGKVVDVTADAAAFTLFISGLVMGGLITPRLGLLLAILMLFNKMLRIWRHSGLLPTNWRFRAVAGFVPALVSYLLYLAFGLAVFGILNYLPLLSRTATVILALDTLITLFLLHHRK